MRRALVISSIAFGCFLLGAVTQTMMDMSTLDEARETVVGLAEKSGDCTIRLEQTERIIGVCIAYTEEQFGELQDCTNRLKICVGVNQ